MPGIHLLGLCGALRGASTNRKLLAEAVRIFAPERYTEGDLRLPLYDGDLEAEGMPAGVTALADAMRAADAIVLATPEYNKAPPGVVKNALDWVSRTRPGPLEGKPLAVISAAAGRGGGDRSQFALRLMLTPLHPRVLTKPEVMIPDSSNAFDEAGRLKAEVAVKGLSELMAALRAEVELLRGRA